MTRFALAIVALFAAAPALAQTPIDRSMERYGRCVAHHAGKVVFGLLEAGVYVDRRTLRNAVMQAEEPCGPLLPQLLEDTLAVDPSLSEEEALDIVRDVLTKKYAKELHAE